MPTTYHCDHCDATAPSLDGWLIVSVQFIHYEPGAIPTGRTLHATAPDLLFDKLECRAAWCATAGIPDPGPLAPPITLGPQPAP